MGKISYETYVSRGKSAADSTKPKVGYFKLANDGEYAIVRFDYASADEFDIVDIHTIQDKDGRWRNIACLRESFKEPKEKCPLCMKGETVKTKFFVKMITYTKDETGKVVVTPVVWERPAKKFVAELKNFINDYGDLRECIFKITRNGAKFVKDKEGKTIPNTDVTYSINYQNPAIYKEELGFVKDFSAFKDFDVSKHSYAIRSAEDIQKFIETGELPVAKRTTPAPEEKMAVPEAPVATATLPEIKVDAEGVVIRPTPVMETPVPTENKLASAPAGTTTVVASPNPVPIVNNEGVVTRPAPAPAPEAPSFDPTNGRPRRTYSWPETK